MHSWSVLEFTHSHRLTPKKKIAVEEEYCFIIQLFVSFFLFELDFSLLRSKATVEELLDYIFGIYRKFGYKNPSILTPSDSVEVAT